MICYYVYDSYCLYVHALIWHRWSALGPGFLRFEVNDRLQLNEGSDTKISNWCQNVRYLLL